MGVFYALGERKALLVVPAKDKPTRHHGPESLCELDAYQQTEAAPIMTN